MGMEGLHVGCGNISHCSQSHRTPSNGLPRTMLCWAGTSDGAHCCHICALVNQDTRRASCITTSRLRPQLGWSTRGGRWASRSPTAGWSPTATDPLCVLSFVISSHPQPPLPPQHHQNKDICCVSIPGPCRSTSALGQCRNHTPVMSRPIHSNCHCPLLLDILIPLPIPISEGHPEKRALTLRCLQQKMAIRNEVYVGVCECSATTQGLRVQHM